MKNSYPEITSTTTMEEVLDQLYAAQSEIDRLETDLAEARAEAEGHQTEVKNLTRTLNNLRTELEREKKANQTKDAGHVAKDDHVSMSKPTTSPVNKPEHQTVSTPRKSGRARQVMLAIMTAVLLNVTGALLLIAGVKLYADCVSKQDKYVVEVSDIDTGIDALIKRIDIHPNLAREIILEMNKDTNNLVILDEDEFGKVYLDATWISEAKMWLRYNFTGWYMYESAGETVISLTGERKPHYYAPLVHRELRLSHDEVEDLAHSTPVPTIALPDGNPAPTATPTVPPTVPDKTSDWTDEVMPSKPSKVLWSDGE